MTVFEGSIRIAGAGEAGLSASLAVDAGRLVVTSQDHEIGDWSVEELVVERRDDAFHIKVEGEELVVAVADPAGFSAGLGIKERRASRVRPGKNKAGRSGRRERRGEEAVAGAPARAWGSPAAAIDDAEPVRRGPSLWDRLPLRWKLSGLGLVALVVLGVLAPGLLALLLILAGVVTLFLSIAATGESGSAFRAPAFFANPAVIAGAIVAVLLGITLFVIV